MRPVRLTRLQPVRLRLQAQRRRPPISKPPPRLLPAPRQQRLRVLRLRLLRVLRRHPHQLAHPVRLLNQPLALNPLRHRAANKMNLGTMRSNLVGRGSRTTKNYFRSSGPFHAPGAVGPMDLPSRGSKMWPGFGRDPRPQVPRELSSLCVRLGELVSPLHSLVGANRRPCDYQMAVREPRPTNRQVASHLSVLTSHLSHPGYVCS